MAVEETPDEFELRATAFVLGELEADAARKFEEQLAKSPEQAKAVASLREAVDAIEGELKAAAGSVTVTDRQRIEQAIEAVPGSSQVVLSESGSANVTSSRRLFFVSISVAACVLMMFGLSRYARLNQAQVASRMQPAVDEEEALPDMSVDEVASSMNTESRPAVSEVEGGADTMESGELSVMESAPLESREMPTRGGRTLADASDSSSDLSIRAEAESKSLMRDASRGSGASRGRQKRSRVLPEPESESFSLPMPGAAESGSSAAGSRIASAPFRNAAPSRTQQNAEPTPLAPSGRGVMDDMMGGMEMGGMEMGGMEMGGMEMGGMEMGDMMGGDIDGMMGGLGGGGGGDVMLGVNPRIVISPEEESPLGLRQRSIPMERSRRGISANRDRYAPLQDNDFRSAVREPLSTFSIDVDTASYTKVRMDLLQFNRRPNPDAVRIEEMINYFEYNYTQPRDVHPFAAAMEVASCPWNDEHRLARIGIQGKVIDQQRPASNLVFLLDVSGSMNRPNKLPLVISGMRMLVNQLGENDSVAIVVYAGAAGLVLDATQGDRKKLIYDSLDRLRAGGSTNGGQGIQLAYEVARQHFIRGGINRVILCSDGDFNVGLTGTDELVTLAEQNAKDNIFLSVFGFGTGNHNDAMMEQISNKANGNYAFIDTEDEARRVFVDQMQGTLVTIAKDVKIQVEFNPAEVKSYRLIGYANRMLAAEDFNDDTKDAGEIGAGHRVTALYEIVPAKEDEQSEKSDENTGAVARPDIDELRYQKPVRLSEQAGDGELLTLKLRYKLPDGDASQLITMPIRDEGRSIEEVDRDFKFAAAVAGFGMLLRDSQHLGQTTFELVENLAKQGADGDVSGYRDEFIEMIRRAKEAR